MVRANYTNLKKDVYETTEFLELFLRNLLLGENNELENRKMHISYASEVLKCQKEDWNVTLDVTLDEKLVLNLLREEPQITQEKIAQSINKSPRTVKRIIDSLKGKGFVSRQGGKRFDYWKVTSK